MNFEAGNGGYGGGGPPNGTDGWSCRLYLRNSPGRTDNGHDMLTYTYHMDQPGDYGETEYWDVSVSRGEWHRLETYVELNSIADDGTANADGIVRCWLNNELASVDHINSCTTSSSRR